MSWKTMRTIGTALGLMLLLTAASYAGDDLTISEKMTVGGATFSTQKLERGSRERNTMDMGTGMPTVTIR